MARAATVASCALALLGGLAGCARGEHAELPAPCRSGAAAFEQALARAPGEVRVDGVRVSECFVATSDPTDVQVVGASLLEVTVRLAGEARRDPDGDAAVRLGYLIGAARRGDERTQGFHGEMVRRLEQELSVVDVAAPAFRRGERAGRRDG